MKSKASKKLTPDDRRLLWQMRKEQKRLKSELAKISNAELAKKMDVHISAIENLFAGRTYSNEFDFSAASIPPEKGGFLKR